MKKTLAILLSLLMLLSVLCACGADGGATADETSASADSSELSAENIVQMYLNNASVWEVADDSEWFYYLFVDLDFDGTLELISSSGSGADSNNRYFRLNPADSSVTEITYSDKDTQSQWDFTGGDYPQLYKNNASGKLCYLVYDNIRTETMAGGMRIGELTMNSDNSISSQNLWGFSYASKDNTANGEFEFVYSIYEDGKEVEVNAEKYDKTLANYEQENTKMALSFKLIEYANDTYTYTSLTKEAKYDLLLEAYNAFAYSTTSQ